jgi:hypothetical protein
MRKRMMSGNDIILGTNGDGVGGSTTSEGEMGDEGWIEGRWFAREDGSVMGPEEVDGDGVTRLITERHL